MKSIRVALVAILSLVASGLVIATWGGTAQVPDSKGSTKQSVSVSPVLRVEGPDGKSGVISFGRCRQGGSVEQRLSLWNTGTQPLRIGRVVTGCGCLSAKYVGPQPLPAGSQGGIEISVSTGGRYGEWKQSLTVLPEGSPGLACEVELHLSIVEGLICETSSIGFGRKLPGDRADAVVKLKSAPAVATWSIARVYMDPSDSSLQYAVSKTHDKDGTSVEVSLSFVASKSIGSHSGRLLIETTDRSRPILSIPTAIVVVEKFVACPRAVNFGIIRRGDLPVTRRILIMPGIPNLTTAILGIDARGDPYSLGGMRQTPDGWELDVILTPGKWITEPTADSHRSVPGELRIRLSESTPAEMAIEMNCVAWQESEAQIAK